MFIEAMLVSGVGFSALCSVSGLGYFDQAAEKLGLQKEGDLKKYQANNSFSIGTMLETDDMVEDIETDIAGIKSIFVREDDDDEEEEEEEKRGNSSHEI